MQIKSILLSVFHKQGLDNIAPLIKELKIKVYSTGGTLTYLQNLGLEVTSVESITNYPSILDGRVKTLHPKIFGGILARRDEAHLVQLQKYSIPQIDCVVVDLYPFEQTVAQTDDTSAIIEKIDIGGISLIRAAAKNYKDTLIIPSQDYYPELYRILDEQKGKTSLEERKRLAGASFSLSSTYDQAISNYFDAQQTIPLRYGENPHQSAQFNPKHPPIFKQLQGKALSYNNYADIHTAIELIEEFWDEKYTFAILKHNNPCGLATRDQLFDAWTDALAGDPVSSFGGILITNGTMDLKTAQAINELFYEVLIAPDFDEQALEILAKKKKRVLLRLTGKVPGDQTTKTLLHGTITQQRDLYLHQPQDWKLSAGDNLSSDQRKEMLFANRIVKHLKSNAIAITKNQQLIGIGCGQTSRVDALRQAIDKAKRFNFDLDGAVMASDAFFPFDDCVKIAHKAGILDIIQPGGSIRDKDSIDYSQKNNIRMVITGIRHFRH